MRVRAVGHEDVHRHAGGHRPDGRYVEPLRRAPHARKREAMALVVRRRTVIALQVVRVDWPCRERNLVVVGVVERLGQGVRRAEPEALAELPLDRGEQRIVLRADARLEVQDGVGTADHRVEHRADRATDEELGAVRVKPVNPGAPAVEAPLDPEVELLHRRVLHRVVDDVDAPGARARQDEPGERIADATGRTGGRIGGPFSGRKNTLPARTSIGSVRPSRPRSSDMISSVMRS